MAAPTVHTAEFLAEEGFLCHGDYNDTDLSLFIRDIPKEHWSLHSDFTCNRALRGSPREFYEVYNDTFDFLYKNEAPSLINLTVHADFGGRPLMSAIAQ
jgi:hypothetical protein